ncbi:carbon-nitrogen hydrolase family protein [Gordonia sp. ABSL1-1]|uniref:carbon-nitrogen hydrolase family protein n=1 Tax=Gordonia sp. ABSL1-1 TaxID=3053923 RepID=UPI0025747737|nr:carbon-nitrogen hydrolase family protein [Gordonia sp. ABSL1-1]MDL9936911.1 carbon-nitrogen hydrolase family protein [Gordonia sp. ABSL1-1]
MRVAMAQISSGADPARNLETVRSTIGEAAAAGAELVVFPEATMCRFGVPLGPVAEELDGPWAQAVSAAAVAAGVTVIAGMFTPAADERVRNTLLIATADGARLRYDKIHLYDAFGFTESRTVAPGSEPVVVDVGGIGIGVATCYDVRFPQLFTTLARRGAQVVVVPASWGAGPGKQHQWQTLVTARALDSTTFTVAVGQAAPTDPDIAAAKAPTGIGHSQITDPFGTVVAAYDEATRVGVHEIDLALVTRAREQLAVLDNEIPFPQTCADESASAPTTVGTPADTRGRKP